MLMHMSLLDVVFQRQQETMVVHVHFYTTQQLESSAIIYDPLY